MSRRRLRRSQSNGSISTNNSPTPPCPDGTLHVIRPEDSWENIAAQYAVGIVALKKANPQIREDDLHSSQFICIPGSFAIPADHTGRRCIALDRTLTAPDLSGVAYINHFTNVLLVIIHGLPAPVAIDLGAEKWLLWLHEYQAETYQRFELIACSNGLHSLRAELATPLAEFDMLIIGTGDAKSTVPNAWRVLVADLRQSCGPF